jgi:predicted nucleic acid-binding protein
MRYFVLDTNIVLHYVRQSELYKFVANKFRLLEPDVQLIISIVTVAEMEVLAQRRNWGEGKRNLLNRFFQDEVFIVDINLGSPDLMDAYVEIDLFSAAQNMGKNDLWIAATSKVTNATLVTTDNDFDHLAGRINIIKTAIN